MKSSVEASTASMEALMEAMEASAKASVEASVKAAMEDMEVSMEKNLEASTEAFTKASTKAFTENSTKASSEVLSRKLPRIRTLPRKHSHGYLGFSSMEAIGSFHGRSKAQRLPRKLQRKLFVKSFEVASTKSWKLHPRNFTFYFNGSFRNFGEISAASTTAPTGIFVLYTTVPPVELTTFSTTWLTHTVYETKGASPYNGCYVLLG